MIGKKYRFTNVSMNGWERLIALFNKKKGILTIHKERERIYKAAYLNERDYNLIGTVPGLFRVDLVFKEEVKNLDLNITLEKYITFYMLFYIVVFFLVLVNQVYHGNRIDYLLLFIVLFVSFNLVFYYIYYILIKKQISNCLYKGQCKLEWFESL